MRHQLLLSGAFLAHLPLILGQGFSFGVANQGAQTKLLGNSFAPIGVDATYDYVVSTLLPWLSTKQATTEVARCENAWIHY